MRQSLIESIKNERDLTSAIVLTHNIDFVFLQLVVLPALKSAGHPKLTVFADAHCVSESYEAQAPVIGGIGTNYRVVPVLMEPGFRFHPKAVLLSGPKRAKLFIGSGNLTFGGWTENGEIWNEFVSDVDGTAQLSSFHQYLEQIVDMVSFPESIRSEIHEAFDSKNHFWASDMEPPNGLIGKAGKGPSLLEQMMTVITTKKVDRLTICSPFFDDEADALQKLGHRFGNTETKVLVQKGRSNLSKAAAAKLPKSIEPVSVTFKRENAEGVERDSYLHAKYYVFEQEDTATIISGSANCSRAALIIPGNEGNAELMTHQTLSIAEFHKSFTSELDFPGDAPDLVPTIEEKTGGDRIRKITITAARWNEGELLIGYRCSEDIKLNRCIVDDYPVSFEVFSKGQACVSCGRPPRYLRLEGVDGEKTVFSNLSWIDQEQELRSTARGRLLGETIRRKAREGHWGVGAWTEILDVFCKHLQYTPNVDSWRPIRKNPPSTGRVTHYSMDDVFTSNYGLSSFSANPSKEMPRFGSATIQQLFLKWFGCEGTSTEDQPENEDEGSHNDEHQDGQDEPVDKPTPLGTEKKAKKSLGVDPIETDPGRIGRFLNQLADIICKPEYLRDRPLEMLASDMKLLSILLLTLLSKKMVKEGDFAKFSSRVWSQLFLTCEADQGLGWLSYRKNNCDDPDEFVRRLASVDLSAAISAWSLRLPFDFLSDEKAVFSLCGIMSAAKMPELWCYGSLDEISEKIAEDLLPLFPPEQKHISDQNLFRKRWQLMVRLGCSIRELEKVIEGLKISELKNQIDWATLSRGELLWQGKRGFCISTENVSRFQKQPAKVVFLNEKLNLIEISADYLIPFKSLLKTKELFRNTKFDEIHRRYLMAFATTVKRDFNSGHNSGR